MNQKPTKIQALFPNEWLAEIDDLIARKFPSKSRADWFRDVVGLELAKQRNGRNEDAGMDELVTLVREIHAAVVKEGSDASN